MLEEFASVHYEPSKAVTPCVVVMINQRDVLPDKTCDGD